MRMAPDALAAGRADVIGAGGMESMSNAPYLLGKARSGYRFGHGELLEHMALDGLEDAYEKRTPMGAFAERTAEKYGFTRAAQDAFAIESLTRPNQAHEAGSFAFESVNADGRGKKGTEQISPDAPRVQPKS